ncbi:type II secretion system protein [Shewanella japonica]|uniref:Methylation site containing protein n=1 Tax=Shewanella japonica TaxID=93973 RepID=A0ABM6JH94_9GAMM|nr:type II secretion system protein [Shewanella japonica]ARD21262.1 Methylation site containing protein [Shewanella japonica]
MRSSYSQRGFTLIELVVVIIILGVLAVVAAPKFLNLKTDAVTANLQSLQASLQSANSLVYSKAAIDSQTSLESGEVEVNGIKIATTVGYITASKVNIPKAVEGDFAELASPAEAFTQDWGIYDVPNSGVYIFPQGYDISSNCNLRYSVTANVAEPAFYDLTVTGC